MRRVDPRRWSLARQVFALLAVAIVVVVCTGVLAAYLQARRNSIDAARQEVLGVAQAVAQEPTVADALTGAEPSRRLQPYAEQVRRSTGTDFVVVMSPQGIRYSHPDPAQIGRRFIGHIDQAAAGHPFTETYTGTLGPSVRAVVPVTRDGRVIGLVAVGITLEVVGRGLARQIPVLVGAGLAALLASSGGAWLLSRRLRRQTHNLGPDELRRMYEFYDAVLHAVHEGLLLLDRHGRLQLVNDEGRRLLGLPADAVGRPVRELGLPPALAEALAAGGHRTDEIHLTGDRVLVVNQAPARWDGRELGTVATLRDHTDLLALTGELDSVRGLAESLRSQAHESANRLHTVVSLIELGHTDRAVQFATAELAGAQELTDRVMGAVQEPVLAALLLGKAAQASERGVELRIADRLEMPADVADPRDLVTIVGNLLDNAIDAAATAPPPRRVDVAATVVAGPSPQLVLRVSDTGPGVDPANAENVFSRGWSTKPPQPDRIVGRGLGLALVAQAVRRHGGQVAVTPGEPGAIFTVHLPVRDAPVTSPVAEEVAP